MADTKQQTTLEPDQEHAGNGAVVGDLEWTARLPRRPGPTPGTEYVQSPWDGLWYEVPKAPSPQEVSAEVASMVGLDAQTLNKIARAETELAMEGQASRARRIQ